MVLPPRLIRAHTPRWPSGIATPRRCNCEMRARSAGRFGPGFATGWLESPYWGSPSARSNRSSRDRSWDTRSEEHTSELQSPCNLVCRLLLEKKNTDARYLELRDLHAIGPLGIADQDLVAAARIADAVYFFFNDRAPADISPLPLPDAFPI